MFAHKVRGSPSSSKTSSSKSSPHLSHCGLRLWSPYAKFLQFWFSSWLHGADMPTPHSCFLGLLLLPRGLFLDSFSHLRFLLPWFSQDRSWWETSPLAIPSWPLHCQELWFSYWHEFCKGMAEWLTPPWLHHHDWLSGICLHRGVYIEIPFYNSSKAFLYFYSYNYPTTSAERIFLIKQMKNWNPREITLTAHFLVYFLVLSAVYS